MTEAFHLSTKAALSSCPLHLSQLSQQAAIISLAEAFTAVSLGLFYYVSSSDLQQRKKANEQVINKCNQAESLHAVTSEPTQLLGKALRHDRQTDI